MYGRSLTVVTDHRACLALINGKSLNKRLIRFALSLQDRDITITYRPGISHGNADSFSRREWSQAQKYKSTTESMELWIKQKMCSGHPGVSATPLDVACGGDVGVATRNLEQYEPLCVIVLFDL